MAAGSFGEKVGADGNKVDADTRDTSWGEAGSKTPLIRTPQGVFLVIVGFLMLAGNISHLAGQVDSPKVSHLLYSVSVAETLDQYFILNLTCSSLVDGASFFVSAIGLMVSSVILYFKCGLEIKKAREDKEGNSNHAETANDDDDGKQFWQRLYGFVGIMAWGAGLYVAGYAAHIYPHDSLEFAFGVVGLVFSFVVAFSGYFFGESVAQFILQMFKGASRVQKLKKVGGQAEMFMGNL